MATERKKQEKKQSNAKEPYKSGKKEKKKKKKESLKTDSLEKEDFGKVPKRSAHHRKQSYKVLNRANPLRRIAG